MKFITMVFLLLASSFSLANELSPLMIDRSVSNSVDWTFPNDDKIKPKASDFQIINYALMSSVSGERLSALTVKNTSSGSRQLEAEHIMALFADGSRLSPVANNLHFKGKETQSITVSFGEHKFPILAIYTSNQ